MHILEIVGGIVIVASVAWDAFATMLLPRRVSRRLRLSAFFLEILWIAWCAIGKPFKGMGRRESFLGLYAVLGLLMLFAAWAALVLLGFAVIDAGLGNAFQHPPGAQGFWMDVYVSGTTIFTLGLGDVVPTTPAARVSIVAECATGLVFLALVISYLPVLYQSFSHRELDISMLDEWAGTPPTAVEMLRRAGQYGSLEEITAVLAQWEHWAAEILESHISFPVLAYFRSQHDNQSWLAALTAVLDTAALSLVGVRGIPTSQARRTFAMARHAAVDLSQVLNASPSHTENPGQATGNGRQRRPAHGSSPPDGVAGRTGVTLAQVAAELRRSGIGMDVHQVNEERFERLRAAYEPYVEALSVRLLMPLPPILPDPARRDNWMTSPWEIGQA